MRSYVYKLTNNVTGELYKGKSLPDKTKKKMSEAQKGKSKSEEHKQKLREGHNQPICSCSLCKTSFSNNTLKQHYKIYHNDII